MMRIGTFRDVTHQASMDCGDQPFLIDDDLLGPVSYAELLHFAIGVEQQLQDLQIPVGASVATIFHNCGLSALLFLSLIASRRVLVPINPLSSQDELDYMIDQAQCHAVILDPTHTKFTRMGRQTTVPITDHRRYFLERRAVGARAMSWSAESSSRFVGEIVFTSGSTGRPKGAVLSEQSLIANAQSLAIAYQLNRSDRFLTVCPLFHNSGQVLTTLACALVGGSTAAIKSDVGMLHFWHYVAKYRAQWSLGMVSFLALLLARKDAAPSSGTMRALLTGGSAIDAGLVHEFETRFGVPVRTVYGLTESASIATCEFLNPSPRSLGSSGRPLPSCDVRIARDNGVLAPSESPLSRESGEIWIGGPTVFEGYVGDEELTRARKQDNWLRTGDLGYFDEHGNLFVVDRLDSMLIVGGENVYPAEIERLSTSLPGASQVVLAGVDHAIWGKELVLVYRTEGDEKPTIATWHRILLEHVAPYKVPQRYVSVHELGFEDFPRRANGKLDRPAIAAALLKARPSAR